MTMKSDQPVEWHIADSPITYPEALAAMEKRVAAIHAGTASEAVWLLEHPPLYTAGTSADPKDLIDPDRFETFTTGRGGQYTYHGPGQRVAYVMLNLNRREKDVRAFVTALENWLINTLAQFNITGQTHPDRVGVWVSRPEITKDREDKIAALGIRIRRWVTFHGVAINIAPDLEHFSGIVPCGIADHGVTSFEDLGHLSAMSEVDMALRSQFETIFGPTTYAQKSRLLAD